MFPRRRLIVTLPIEVLAMRYAAYFLILTGVSYGQTMTEFGAAAVVGTVGGASGKQVSRRRFDFREAGDSDREGGWTGRRGPAPRPALTLGPAF